MYLVPGSVPVGSLGLCCCVPCLLSAIVFLCSGHKTKDITPLSCGGEGYWKRHQLMMIYHEKLREILLLIRQVLELSQRLEWENSDTGWNIGFSEYIHVT